MLCGLLVLAVVVMGEDWRPLDRQPLHLSRQSRRADKDLTLQRTREPTWATFLPHTQQQRARPVQPLFRRGRQEQLAVSFSPSEDPAAAYGASEPQPEEEQEPVDLHNKEFCVDVSTFDPVTWVEREGEECETVFVKQCEDKTENVCADVTETTCKVAPFTVCEMGLEPQEAVSTMLAPKLFVEKECSQGRKEIPHTKLLPECRNVTKQNCVTLWETDADGKQQWAGTDACEPVTWQECKLVPKDVKFIVPEITCEPKQELWYHEPEERTDTRMTNTFDCKVKSTSHCTSQTRPDCKQITWNECKEVPVKNCSPKSVHVPTQELLHRKKCLLPDTDTTATGYGAPQADTLPSYGAPPPPPPVYKPAPQPTYSG